MNALRQQQRSGRTPVRLLATLFVASVAMLGLPLASWAAALGSSAVDANGEFWQVREGLYMDLFPDGTDSAPWNPVLALQAADGSRTLVPGTEGIELDSSAALFVDGDQLFVFWTLEQEQARYRFRLVSFDGASFSQPIELSGEALRITGPSKAALTRDTYTVIDADGQSHDLDRTTLHIVWWESAAGSGELQVLYTPVILLDGAFVGWNPVIPLDVFDSHDPLDEPLGHLDILRASTLQASSHRSVVLGLPQLTSGRLLGMKIDVLPADLLRLADEARSHIVLVGRAAPAGPDGIEEIANHARSHIVLVGRADLHPGVRQHIAESVAAKVLERETFEPEELEELAEEAWHEALASGASILGNPNRSSEFDCGILALDPATNAVLEPHYLQLCLNSDRVLPETPADTEHHLRISETAEEVLVAWVDEEGRLGYRVSTSEGWTEIKLVELPSGITRRDALAALAQQLRPE